MIAPSIQDAPENEYKVTPLELFFDLVFVFAVSQLSHYLLIHLSWRGAAETLVMLMAVFAAWFSTSWSATMISVDHSRTRWLVLVVMLLGLFMNASVNRAFTTSGWAFVIPFLTIQLGRTVWTLVNSANAVFREHYFRTLLWLIATTPLWITGAAVNPDVRLIWWALAAGIDQIGRWLAHPIPGRWLRSENASFDANHMLERCQLFLLIALGETVFTIGMSIAASTTRLMTVITGTVALVGTVALWALAFGRAHRLTAQHIDETRDPVRASRHAVNVLMMMVAGLIAMAVANELVISHPLEHASTVVSALLYGGPILFLLAQGWYYRFVLQVWPRLHLIGSATLFVVSLVTLATPQYVALILVGVCLTILVIFDR